MKRVVIALFALSGLVLLTMFLSSYNKDSLLAPVGPNSYIPLGKGCTNAWYIDEDCDGYGVAAQTVECRGDCGPTRQGKIGDKVDANDKDSLVNTAQTVHSDSRYGNPSSNMAGFRSFLRDKFQFNPGNIYFISLTPSSNPQPNNVARPYPLSSLNSLIASAQGGDIIMFREGTYFTIDGQGNRQGPLIIDNKVVPSGSPLVFTSYPGERVIFDGIFGASISNSDNIVIDGFIITCGDVCDDGFGFWGGYKGIGLADNLLTSGITIQNTEITRFQWGIHGGLYWGKTKFIGIVSHDNSAEHNIYSPANCYPAGNPLIQRDISIIDSLLYRGRRTGYQMNGPAENILLSGNIIHSNGGAGITFTSGVRNSKIVNNIVFNNNHYALVIWHDFAGGAIGEQQGCTRGNENNEITNNLFMQGDGWNGVCNSGGDRSATGWVVCAQQDNPSTFASFTLSDSRPAPNSIFLNHNFRNNIFITGSSPIIALSDLDDISNQNSLFLDNNIFVRSDGNMQNGLISVRWAQIAQTDGTHTSSCCSPTKYIWSLFSLENHPVWGSRINNNIELKNLKDLFKGTQYRVSAPAYHDFRYPLSSPAIDSGIGKPGVEGIPEVDIKGNPRTRPVSIGPYE